MIESASLETIARYALARGREYTMHGNTASYIPELGKAPKDALGICIAADDGAIISCGDTKTRFTAQSISKIITFALALETMGFDAVSQKVSMEPSGDAFNSIIKLDTVSNRPYNPMINCGAIEIASALSCSYSFEEIVEYARKLCSDPTIEMNEDVYRSETKHGDRNRAIGYLLKSKEILTGEVDTSVDLYIRLCSLEVTAESLANFGLLLARGGKTASGVQLLDPRTVRTLKTVMLTCGMYDGSGDFAVRVGIPAKSGVGGGIVACADGFGIGCYGPALDQRGNSIGGIHMLEYISDRLHLHLFDH